MLKHNQGGFCKIPVGHACMPLMIIVHFFTFLLVTGIVQMSADDFVELLMFPGHVVERIGQIVVAGPFGHVIEVLLQILMECGLLPEE